MKRCISMLLLCSLLLSGCSIAGERIKDPVAFYYVQKDYQEHMDTVIGSELRETAGHRNDLSYLLALYTMGPASDELLPPLPRGTTVSVTEHAKERIVLALSEEALKLTDAQYTLSGACLAMTCMELTDAAVVTVTCEDRKIDIRRENLMLQNPGLPTQMEETK